MIPDHLVAGAEAVASHDEQRLGGGSERSSNGQNHDRNERHQYEPRDPFRRLIPSILFHRPALLHQLCNRFSCSVPKPPLNLGILTILRSLPDDQSPPRYFFLI